MKYTNHNSQMKKVKTHKYRVINNCQDYIMNKQIMSKENLCKDKSNISNLKSNRSGI